MATWFSERIVETGRLPLFCFFAGMVVGFVLTRLSVRLIRANVRWFPGNITSGGLHIHHVVFGIVFMVVFGVAGLAISDDLLGGRSFAAAGFGVGTALVLDEFALVLHLEDVYWTEEGRTSIDALFAVIAVTALLLLGWHPFLVEDLRLTVDEEPLPLVVATLPLLVLLALAAITVLKGKIWTGLAGMFVPLLLLVGASRLARPRSPWARWRYRPGNRQGTRKLILARRRERHLRRPVVRAKIWFQNLIAGAPDRPPPDQTHSR